MLLHQVLNRRFIGAFLFIVMLAQASMPAVADQCSFISGGKAECVPPLVGSWESYAVLVGNPYVSTPECGLDSSTNTRCEDEDEAMFIALNKLKADNPTLCSLRLPHCDAPNDEVVARWLGVNIQYTHDYNLWVAFADPNGQCPAEHLWAGCDSGNGIPAPALTWKKRPAVCPPGTQEISGREGYCMRLKDQCCSVTSKGPLSTLTAKPIHLASGQKTNAEPDIRAVGASPLEFTRYYSSGGFYTPIGTERSHEILGEEWRHTYQREIDVQVAQPGQVTVAYAVRADGDYRSFTLVDGTWTGRLDASEQLQELIDGAGQRTGWRYTTANDNVELYDAAGHLLSVTTRSGLSVSITYSVASTPVTIAPHAGLPILATDSFGRTIAWRYNSQAQLVETTDPSGTTFGYRYDLLGRLEYADLPGLVNRHYAYNETEHLNYSPPDMTLLTGIFDENGSRYLTYEYDGFGMASKEWVGTGADMLTVEYDLPYRTYVTDAFGIRREKKFTVVDGVIKYAGTLQPSCAGPDCTPLLLGSTVTYDPVSGNPASESDLIGTVTTYAFNSRALETQRVDASNDASPAATSAKRTINTVWNPSTAIRVPDQRTTLNANGATEAQTKWTYNARGQATARCEIDPNVSGASTYVCGSATNAPVGVRQSTTTYCEQAGVTAGTCPLIGLVTSVNGARLTTDAGMGGLDDLTTYTYYQTDDATCASNGACTHRHGDLWKVTNALGKVTENISYDKSGRVTRIKDANGTYTDLVYHARGWLTDRIVRANAIGTPGAGDATMHIDYDAVGNVTKVTQPDGAFLAYTYDDAHRLTKITDNLSNAIDYCPGGVGNAECLDAAGKRKVEQVKDPSGTIKRSLHRVYNQLNQLTQVLNAASLPVERSDGLNAGYVVDGYDGNGNRVLKQDGLGNKTEQDVDPLNRLKTTIQNVGGADTATKDATTGYVYDARDNLRQVTDPDLLNTVYDYDGLNNLTGLHSPDTGLTTYTPDAAGNRVSQTDNRGQVSNYTYDALNRLTTIAYVNATGLNAGYAYDQADAITGCVGSFAQGRLTTMTDASGSTTYCYDRRGNVLKKKQVPGSVTLVTNYTYNSADRLLSITYPSGGVATYTRDSLGRVLTIGWAPAAGSKSISIVKNTSWYPFGPLNTVTFGNNRTLTKAYDQDYAIDSISGTPAGALTLDFGVDVMGNITNASATLNPTTPDRSYLYDPLYRLTTAQTGATPAGPLEAYTYNKTGDRFSAALNGGAAQIYSYAPSTHHLTSVGGVARTYDPNGNTQTGITTGLTLSYDARNRLSAMAQGKASASYSYNSRGERVNKQNNPALGQATNLGFAYGESGQLLGEYTAATSPQAEYIYLDSVPVAVVKAGVPYYIETDHLGTPRQVIDKTRNAAVWKWDSLGNTFGTGTPNQDPDGDSVQFVFNLRFPGQYFDNETGLNYNYSRFYEASSGRYIQSDRKGLRGSIALYAYVGSSPIRFMDPKGFEAWQGCKDGSVAPFGGCPNQTFEPHKCSLKVGFDFGFSGGDVGLDGFEPEHTLLPDFGVGLKLCCKPGSPCDATPIPPPFFTVWPDSPQDELSIGFKRAGLSYSADEEVCVSIGAGIGAPVNSSQHHGTF